ncbi:hypothetical protein K466DRAFT_651656 [Polyporus arcularius HHB13444]|uniref:Uncharacterized protein n=1 Tax=Polyporus arcularius HHB13444 TaxID=1314778 RepID=A0A5C3PPQ4_9APHY|nr:hypothetical protein K466DRAFT_651656 [Polyporus arcularius HHB13444]
MDLPNDNKLDLYSTPVLLPLHFRCYPVSWDPRSQTFTRLPASPQLPQWVSREWHNLNKFSEVVVWGSAHTSESQAQAEPDVKGCRFKVFQCDSTQRDGSVFLAGDVEENNPPHVLLGTARAAAILDAAGDVDEIYLPWHAFSARHLVTIKFSNAVELRLTYNVWNPYDYTIDTRPRYGSGQWTAFDSMHCPPSEVPVIVSHLDAGHASRHVFHSLNYYKIKRRTALATCSSEPKVETVVASIASVRELEQLQVESETFVDMLRRNYNEYVKLDYHKTRSQLVKVVILDFTLYEESLYEESLYEEI